MGIPFGEFRGVVERLPPSFYAKRWGLARDGRSGGAVTIHLSPIFSEIPITRDEDQTLVEIKPLPDYALREVRFTPTEAELDEKKFRVGYCRKS
ncbi:MAG: hypothetical protein IIA14_06770 [SAR324 cluster bacterium]|nr:hypothetical protein [SAR324 cluster bacterium]